MDEAAKNKIRIIGEVTTAQLAALYTDASAFCYPSLLEGFGLPVLEAMSYNTPVVTSKGTATEEVAGDAALMVDPASVDEVSDALDFLLTSESEAQKNWPTADTNEAKRLAGTQRPPPPSTSIGS